MPMADGATLRADLHTHTFYSPDSVLSPRLLVKRCRSQGVDCVAVTDHNTIRGGLAARELADGLCVIVGEEVRSAQGEILGLFLSEEIPKGLSAAQTIRRIREQGGLVGIPHPFDSLRSALHRDLMDGLADEIDFIEVVNSRIVVPVHNKLAAEFARKHGLAASAGSDAHSGREVGRAYVEMRPFEGAADFLQALRSARVAGRLSSPLIHLVSRYATLRHKLGWRPQ